MFSVPEAMGLVMAVIEGRGSADTDDPVGHALGKIIRVLPEPVAAPTSAVRQVSTLDRFTPVTPGPEVTGALVQACAAHRRVRLGYLLEPDDQREMDVDPWAVVVRRGRWYLLCWSHTRDARRLLRVDRVATVEALAETFTPPEDLDAHRTVEEHLSASDEGRKLIKSARQELRSINHEEIEDIIAGLVGCAVLRSHCDVSVEAAEQVEVYILAQNIEKLFVGKK